MDLMVVIGSNGSDRCSDCRLLVLSDIDGGLIDLMVFNGSDGSISFYGPYGSADFDGFDGCYGSESY